MNSAESGALKSYVTQYHIMDPTPIALLYKSYDISEIKKRNLKGIPRAAYLQIKSTLMGLWKIFLHYLSSSSIIIQNLSMILNFISKIWRFNFYCSGFKKKYHWILRCHPWLAITLNRISQWPCNWKKEHDFKITQYRLHRLLLRTKT